MIILRSPKGWTGPKEVDGRKVEGFWRAHQVPVDSVRNNPGHLQVLEDWLRSYQPERLFDGNGRLRDELRALAPTGKRRMGANPHANGGVLKRDLKLPDFTSYALQVETPGAVLAEPTRIMGQYLREVIRLNAENRNFRLMGPDETASNRLDAVFEATDRVWMEDIYPYDLGLARYGRVMEVLSEHLCQGWLEGYLLTGRHGLFNCYEAFVHIVDSMFNQHAKWLKEARELPWRGPIASLNYLLSSHVWRQDHNGFSHQDPGFVDLVANKKADIVRIYMPPDANTLLWTADHVLRTWNRINVIVAGKQPGPQWLTIEEAVPHCEYGLGVWDWACLGPDKADPDLVMACAGDVPTVETLAAVDLLHQAFPELAIRVVNIADLMALQPQDRHPHGISDADFDSLFTRDRPVIFAYHGYPYMIHRLTYTRTNHDNIHVHGFIEEGTTTTPFDMVVLNQLDRFHLAMSAVDRLPSLGRRVAEFKQALHHKLNAHTAYIREHGEDMPEIRDWTWPHDRTGADEDWD
jgi:xylulose-5-phosphate/fructose-6-phosphate phosphoketolase